MPLRLRKLLDKATFYLSAFLLLGILICVAGEILLLYISGPLGIRRVIWLSEAATIMLVWMVFIGSANAFSRRMQLSIDFFYALLPGICKKTIDFFAKVLAICLSAVMVFYGMRYAILMLAPRTGALIVSQAYFFMAIPVSFAIMFFYALTDFLIPEKDLENEYKR